MKMYEKIIIGISLFIVLLWLWCQISYPRLNAYAPLTSKFPALQDRKSILKEANNGDILFLCGTTYTENILKYLGDCIFSHIGIIVREDDDVYVWDCDMGQGYKDGVRVMLLEDKLKRFKGEKIGCIKKLRGAPLSKKRINDVLHETLNITFYNGVWKWLMADVISPRENEKEMFCSEFVAYVFQTLKVLPGKDSPYFKVPYAFTPEDFFKGKVRYIDPYFHGENTFFEI